MKEISFQMRKNYEQNRKFCVVKVETLLRIRVAGACFKIIWKSRAIFAKNPRGLFDRGGVNIFTKRWFVYWASLRSRRYSRVQEGKLEIPPAQKLSILSSAHRAHGSAHTKVFALENQSERELLIMLLAGLQCSKRCQFNNCFVFFCHGEQNNSHETFAKAYTLNIMLFPNPVGKIAIIS